MGAPTGLPWSRPLHTDALVRAPRSDLRDLGLADLLDADVCVLSVLSGVPEIGPARDLPLSRFVDEAISELELHRENALLGGRRRTLLALLLGPRPSGPIGDH